MLTELQGQIERITYTNQENAFTIARLRVKGYRQPVTVVGNLPSANPGEVLLLKGDWVTHPRYGKQFKAVYSKSCVPASVNGIQKYLGSGLIRGIGPVLATRIVQKFGAQTLSVIDNKIDRLTQIDGIGKKRITMIREAWEEQKEIRSVMLFLQSHGVSSAYATKIFKRYGAESVDLVKENPYRLAEDIVGIGFLTADRIAEKLGFDKNSMMRAQSGILHVLHQLADDGHLYFPSQPLVKRCREILEVDQDLILQGLDALSTDQKLVIEAVDRGAGLTGSNRVYLVQLHHCETQVAHRLRALKAGRQSFRRVDSETAVEWVQQRLSIQLAQRQVRAVKCAATGKVTVITGGPGTGKTTVISAILKIFERLRVRVLLAAPTGRAAKRMTETTGHQAQTIHRMLKYSLQKGGFQKNEESPLKCDLLIVDEASMIDAILMHHLLKAVPSHATLVLVGDVHQLPSVGPGNVLRDIIDSGSVPVVALNEIFRQARRSSIVVNAHRINRGLLPQLKSPESKLDDFYFIEQESPEEAVKIIVELAKERIPRRFDFDPLEDIQILTPMHKGVVGATNLNSQLQQVFNPSKLEVTRGERSFRLRDKVMQIRNNYDKDVFNGDIGCITNIHQESQNATICFDGRPLIYDFSELDEVVLSYAISVHKSQGSEYKAVILPIFRQHYLLLQRNLIYTAVTRARDLVVLVGSWKALVMGIKNNKTQKRFSHLSDRLQDPQRSAGP